MPPGADVVWLRWRFATTRLCHAVRALRPADRWLVGVAVPALALYAATRAARVAAALWPLSCLAAIAAGASSGFGLALLQSRRARRMQTAAWLAPLPVSLALRRRMRLVDHAVLTAIALVQVFGAGALVATLCGKPIGGFHLLALGLAMLSGAALALSVCAVQRQPTSFDFAHATMSMNRGEGSAGQMLPDWLERRAPRWAGARWAGVWALETRAVRRVTVVAGWSGGVALGFGAVATGQPGYPAAAALGAHLGFVALLQTRLLNATALRCLPLGFGAALSGVVRAPLWVTFLPVLVNAFVCLTALSVEGVARMGSATAIAVAVVPGLLLADLAYLCICLASGGWRGVAIANYLVFCIIMVTNLTRFGISEFLIAALLGVWALRRARRRFAPC